MSQHTKQSYFRPWSPPSCDKEGHEASKDQLRKEWSSTNLSQPQSLNDQAKAIQQVTSLGSQRTYSKDHTCRCSKESSAMCDYVVHSQSKTLVEQLQPDHHNYPQVLNGTPLQENILTLGGKGTGARLHTGEEHHGGIQTHLRTSHDHRMADSWRGVTCLQNRDIFNIHRPTLNIGHHHASAFRRIRQPHYPVPSAKDGEPLDLLPKSLYTNKANGGHLCIFCGKLYSRKYGLKIHLRTHTGYKPLHCKICQRPFGDPSNLNKHIRLHAEGNTPYRCGKCGKVLVRRRDLERHVRSRHSLDVNNMASIGQASSPLCFEDGRSSSSCSSYEEGETMEELDVVGLY